MKRVDPLIQDILEAHGAPRANTDWAEKELGLAHRLIDDVMQRYHPDDDVHVMLKNARENVEAADCEIEKFHR